MDINKINENLKQLGAFKSRVELLIDNRYNKQTKTTNISKLEDFYKAVKNNIAAVMKLYNKQNKKHSNKYEQHLKNKYAEMYGTEIYEGALQVVSLPLHRAIEIGWELFNEFKAGIQ